MTYPASISLGWCVGPGPWSQLFSGPWIIRRSTQTSFLNVLLLVTSSPSYSYCEKKSMFLVVSVLCPYPSSHNHGSGKWIPPILVSFHLGWCSTSMVMGERVKATLFSGNRWICSSPSTLNSKFRTLASAKSRQKLRAKMPRIPMLWQVRFRQKKTGANPGFVQGICCLDEQLPDVILGIFFC